MCGITAYVGNEPAANKILASLKKLEYRGYDSAGIAFFENEKIEIIKAVGTISELEKKMQQKRISSNLAIGHTRWATHGKASLENAHPHSSQDKKVCVIHNGIIENYQTIKNELKEFHFASQTDTEVFANYFSKNLNGGYLLEDVLRTLGKTITKMKGSFSFAIMIEGFEDKIFFIKEKSPLVLGVGNGFHMLSSDEMALDEKTEQVVYLSDGDYGFISKNSYCILSNGKIVKRRKLPFTAQVQSVHMGKFTSFMEKEIEEGSFACFNTMLTLLNQNLQKLEEAIKNSQKVFVVGCGTALHAGEVFKYVLEKECKTDVFLDYASEFRYKKPNIDKNSLCIFISQSGETADTLASASYAKGKGATLVAVTNVKTSRITKICNIVVLTRAGVEVSVASTKAYMAQLSALYFLITIFGKVKNEKISFSPTDILEIYNQKKEIIDAEKITLVANHIKNEKSLFFVGRGLDYFLAKEGALKLKEITYIHCEAFAGGEMKHGSLSLIDDESFVVCVLTQKNLLDKMMSNIIEMQSRGAKVILFSPFSELQNKVFCFVPLKKLKSHLMPFVAMRPLQMLALKCCEQKSLNPDMPRNLAKSVTVE